MFRNLRSLRDSDTAPQLLVTNPSCPDFTQSDKNKFTLRRALFIINVNMLDRLPPEVLLIALEVSEYLRLMALIGLFSKQADLSQYITRHDLNNICRVSKHLYAIAVPLLYKSVTLSSNRPGISETWHHVDSLLRAPAFPVDSLVHMRDIKIQENRFWPWWGCHHSYTILDQDDPDDYKEARIRRDEIRYLSSKLLHMFSRCAADRLQKFR